MAYTHPIKLSLATLAVLLLCAALSSAQTVAIAVDPPSLSWGLVSVGSTGEEKDVVFHNATSATVTFSSIATSGGDFAIASNTDKKCGASVPARTWCLVGVTFSPTALGSRSGTLTFVYDASNSPLTVPLSGTGSGPLTAFPISLAFGGLRVGSTSSRRAVTLTNHLKTALDISATGATGDFAIARNTCGVNIAAGQKCFIEATFTPTADGPRTGQLTITYGPPSTSLVANLTGTGTITGLTVAREHHTATLLNNGMVLVTGGAVCTPFCSYLASAELYDPATGTFTSTGSLSSPRAHHTATLLNNGMVLIAGGEGSGNSLASAELYDPATGAFTPSGKLTVARHLHTATLLSNGMVLLAGGVSRIGRNLPNRLGCAELYDPAAKTFNLTGCLNTARDEHTATLLNNGMVLVVGGNGNPPAGHLASAEVYDPATGAFASTGMLSTPRYLHSATLLKNGMVLIAGGVDPKDGPGAIASAELYNPATRAFTPTGILNTARYRPTASLLNNGMVQISGGANEAGFLSTAELYNPGTQKFVATGSLNIARIGHSITVLNNGTVLIVGGQGEDSALASAELYDPKTGTFTTTR